MTLGQQISLLRKQKNLSQEELAAEMDVSRQSVSKWETGLSRPDTENLIRLAKILEVDVNVLIGCPEASSPTVLHRRRNALVCILSILLVVSISFAAVFAVLWQTEKSANNAKKAEELTSIYKNVTLTDCSILPNEKEIELTPQQQRELVDFILGYNFTNALEDAESPIPFPGSIYQPENTEHSFRYGGNSYRVTFDLGSTQHIYLFSPNGTVQTIKFYNGQSVLNLYHFDLVVFNFIGDLCAIDKNSHN